MPDSSSWPIWGACVVVMSSLASLACASTPASDEDSKPAVAVVDEAPTARRFVQRSAKFGNFVEAQLPLGWRLPHGGSGLTPLLAGLGIGLQREGLFLGDELLVPAVDGKLVASGIDNHLILTLDERLELLGPALEQAARNRGETWNGHANLYLDPGMLVGDLIDTIYTLGRAGFMSYHFAVAGGPQAGRDSQPITAGVYILPPKLYVDTSGQAGEATRAGATSFYVYLSPRKVILGRRRSGEVEIVELLEWNEETMQKLGTRAAQEAELLRQSGSKGLRTAIFIAAPTLTIEPLIAAMIASSGPGCDDLDDGGLDGSASSPCYFQVRIIEAGTK